MENELKVQKIKYCKTALIVNSEDNFKALQPLSKEITKLASDDKKNEKIGIIFRVARKDGDKVVIEDISNKCEKVTVPEKVDGKYKFVDTLLDGRTMLKLANEYTAYVKSQKFYKPDMNIEMIYYYYPLDASKPQNEISEKDKIVERIPAPRIDIKNRLEILRASEGSKSTNQNKI